MGMSFDVALTEKKGTCTTTHQLTKDEKEMMKASLERYG